MTNSTEDKTPFQKLIAEIADAFESDTRADGATFYKLKDAAPEWMQGYGFMGEVHEAVDGGSPRMPDDWIYEHTMRVADRIKDYDAPDADAARNYVGEIACGLVDVYTMDRLKWLALHLNNASLCDEATEERGAAGDIAAIIGAGQYMALERIAEAIISAAESRAESSDDDDDDDTEDESEEA